MGLILRFLKPFLISVVCIVLLTFVQVIADLLLPNYMARIVDEGIAKHNPSFILRSGSVMLAISLVGITCATMAGYLASKASLGVGRNIRNALFRHVSGYSLSEFDKVGTSSLVTRTTNDVQQVQTTVFAMLRMMLRAPLMCIGAIIMAVQKDRSLSLILLSLLPFVVITIFIVTRKAMPLFRSMQKKLDRLNLVLRENLVGIRIVRAFSRNSYEKKRFASANADLTDTSIRVNRLMAILNPSMMLAMSLMNITIVWIASFQIDKGNLMIGDMMAFIQYAMQIFMSLMMLTMLFILLPRAFASAERISEVLTLQAEVVDKPQQVEKQAEQGCLTFSDVTFRYDSAELAAVDNVSFTVNRGEVLAIIGGTGSGKSSLVNLIPRYYDIDSGAIYVDGVDIRHMRQEELRAKLGFVPQKAVLFSGTVSDNVRFGKQNATDDEVRYACEVAQAAEFIGRMPKGYRSVVAQGGTNLSGGQKQRLSIARALVRKPEIYIFDDSFSALDYKTDAALQAALKAETDNAAVVIVAQRVTSIMHANRILVMDKGAVVAEGTHDELMKRSAIYREIVSSQLTADEV